ncbi:hypothetical protein LCGC14_0754950 [marine sediment metagenome]|uniref:Uncharacterized protein n=1 Tax=marine sediment metagenome TaxID=412755 RepID=A0A0F9T9Y5_9ZZZZ
MLIKKFRFIIIFFILFFFIFQNVVFLDSHPLPNDDKDTDDTNLQLSLQREWEIVEDEHTIGLDVVKDNEQNIYIAGDLELYK